MLPFVFMSCSERTCSALANCASPPKCCSLLPAPCPCAAAGNYTLQLSASNPNGYSGLSPSTAVSVGFSTKPRFWSVQGSLAGATLKIIRPDSVSEPTNLRYKITILRAGDSGSSGTFRDAAFETHTGTGTLDDPATISIPLSAFGAGVNYAQVHGPREGWPVCAACTACMYSCRRAACHALALGRVGRQGRDK